MALESYVSNILVQNLSIFILFFNLPYMYPEFEKMYPIHVVMVYQHIFAIFFQFFFYCCCRCGCSPASLGNVEVHFEGSAMRLICTKMFVVKNSLFCFASHIWFYIRILQSLPHIRKQCDFSDWNFRCNVGSHEPCVLSMQQNRTFRRVFIIFVCNAYTNIGLIIIKSFVFKFFMNIFR